jgi:hypothetical protein
MLSRNEIRSLCASAVLVTVLSACGGGGGSDSSSSSSYLAVTGTKNVTGKPITTVCIDNIANAGANTTNGANVTANLARFYLITGNYQTTSSDAVGCSTLPGAVIVTVSYYNDTILPWIRANPVVTSTTTTSNTPTATTSTSTATSSQSGSNTQYVQWTGNTNGGGIRDASNDVFGVRSSDRTVMYWPGNNQESALTGLSVNSSASVIDSGQTVGYVTLKDGSTGAKIAVFSCLDGSTMDIIVSAAGWYQSCSVSSTPSGTTGGSSGGSGSNTSAPPTRNFITWTNSSNGVVVKDASNDSFSFYQDTRCIYSYNTGAETSNFCLASNSYLANFAGLSVRVTLAAAIGGGCIAVLSDSNGYQVDIFTSSTQIQTARIQTTRWDTTGC